ncbi:ATP-dependent Clp protease proteolytic subunit [Comamonas testosteroni]|uniref:ATP-dependent Clp protease proteolytic subunit n=1 Tax=Comamonas testosteroni TaxID=285 RepID=UPI000B102583|nr:ATP-dependent Clp protease proteolytic subunit [Comamonas testosteroni]
MSKSTNRFPLLLKFLITVSLALPQICFSLVLPSNDGKQIYVYKSIEKGDAQIFQDILQNKDKNSKISLLVILDSSGGSIEEAFKIGRIIRKEELSTLIPLDGSCLSSCVFILAAGIHKTAAGKVGIHRPYFPIQTNIDADSALKNIRKKTEDYLDEMNIPKSLADEMFSVNPHEIRYLKNSEKNKYRLDGEDIAHAENRTLRQLKWLGIDRNEYIRRERIYKTKEESCIKKYPNLDLQTFECTAKAKQEAGLVKNSP